MGQALTEQPRRTGLEIPRRRDAAPALSRLHDAVRTQNALHRSVVEELRLLVDDIVLPGAAEKAMVVAGYLNREFPANIRRSEQALRTAIAADAGLKQVLGPKVDTLFKRLRGLERLASPVRRAIAGAADPGQAAIPFSLIHDGLEFIEQLRRHGAWTAENILPAVVFHYRQAVAEADADIGERRFEERVKFDDFGNAAVERQWANRPNQSLQALIRDLQEICGTGNPAQIAVSPA